ncbi:hypothetical protein [Paenibacillus gansuensis]|uniref:OmpH family outer membrane protein n=1 Tax=Paenibacillus gansuensis TaxID=306542 RepID=A0ABW5PKF7_9BACL
MVRRGKKPLLSKSKVAAGLVSLTISIAAVTGVSYADIDIAGSLLSWYNKKAEISIESLEQAVKSETEIQKEMLKTELQSRLEQSSKEMDAFTEEQTKLRIEAIRQYAAALLEQASVSNEQDKQQLLDKLNAIETSAQQAMDSLMDSYDPPALTFTPSLPAEQVQPGVTGDVYGE